MDPETFQIVLNVGVIAIALVSLAVLIATGALRERALAKGPARDLMVDKASYTAGVLMVLGYVAAMIALGGLGAEGDQPAALIALQLIPFVIIGLAIGRLINTPDGLGKIGLKPENPGRDAAWSLAAGVIALGLVGSVGIALNYLFIWLDDPPPEVVHQTLENLRSNYSPDLLIQVIISAVVLAPLFEEIIFRGVLQTGLLNLLGRHRWAAILLTSFVFSITHWWAVSYHGLIPLFVVGLVFGYIYERTGSLFAAILTHALFNALNIAITLWMPAG